MFIATHTALLLVFNDFSKVVAAEAIPSNTFKIQLKRLENTLEGIEPVSHRPLNDIIRFISYLKRAKRLVLKSSRISFRNKYQHCLHSTKLSLLNNKLLWFFQMDLQAQMMSRSIGIQEFTLDLRSDNCSLPDSINRMDQLKVLHLTCHDDYPYKLHNLSFVTRLSSLTTIKFEHVSIPSLHPVFGLKILKQLSFIMCEINDAFMSFTTESRHRMPNLTCLEFNMCYDLKQLPSGLCNLVNLQKLSITNYNELDVLPKQLGDLSNLESLNLHCCTKLQDLPASIGSLRNLSSIDISDCLSISVLPEEIGELCGLRVLKMNGCTGLQELPMSISKLSQLEEVICDEETSYMWMDFESDLHNLKIDVVEDDRLESFMKIVK